MNYINSGAVSPDEIRNVLREDTNSAFNALEGDAPNDPIDFDPDNDPFQDLNRGSSNGQHPFKSVSQGEAQCLALSETVDDRRYDRSDFGSEGNEAIFDCTGGKSVSRGEAQYSTHDEWNEADHPRKSNGQFGRGGGGSNNETTESFAKSKEKIKSNIKNAIEQIIKGEKEEVVIKNVRNDLEKYGGTNDVSFIKGNEKGGISHFSKKHKEDIEGVIEALTDGKITSHVPNRKVFIEHKDYLAILSLDYHGNKKTWLLTGYKKDK